MNSKSKILIAEDDSAFAGQLAEALKGQGYEIVLAKDGSEAIQALKKSFFDLCFIDLAMPGVDGMAVIEESLRIAPDLPFVMVTGYATIDKAVKAIKLGAYDFVEKPVSLERLLITAKNAIEKRRLKQKTQLLSAEILNRYKMIGSSAPMRKIYDLIKKISQTNSTVLITGETGTGKELAAVALHWQSNRASGPFVKVNCAAIPETLIESELFGHKKGAFTNAVSDKIGKFELADKGTIFLDEIGDMSLNVQAKVLRVLQEFEFEPVGDNKIRKVDVRVIAATNKPLYRLIEEGKFREDLFYRLKVIEIDMPPLRIRKDDIPELIEFFLRQFSDSYNRCFKILSKRALDILCEYDWPGNVRELKGVAEKLVVLTEGDTIREQDVSEILFKKNEIEHIKQGKFKDVMIDVERDFIKKTLNENNWNVTRSADVLGLNRTSLYKKMKNLGISRDSRY